MVDFTKNKSWAATQTIEDDADAGNIGKVAQTVFVGDLNTFELASFHAIGSTATNSPLASAGTLIVSSFSAESTLQIFAALATDRQWFRLQSAGAWRAWVELFHSGNAANLPLTTAFAPSVDNALTLGDASGRWSEVFAGNATINTSDAREKTEITPLTFDEIEASKQLANEIGTYKFLASIEAKGSSARTHIGMTVQRAIEIMVTNNLDPMSYGFICFNSWDEEVEAILDGEGEAVLDENEQPTYEVTKEASDRYGFRYDQLNQFILAGFNARLEAAGI